ncbi:keratin, type II cytoskeletal cochleal-like [Betta splendens]|uniref:Keratin, type II cytoskeletal cochleal-like n=1 Tax=Betta splendens TaxID=158456 RepID=A0A9W2XXS9_BETSP|nr:keratin, type II cytoskeletal cochleal-like [Betta splendens]XP_055366461.1 keratin, type II cytoskeletal cochleal-like [Betta splendens]XP_055366462.1 keratin, type II cytoskeletal cochleal-like [Betta splendens]
MHKGPEPPAEPCILFLPSNLPLSAAMSIKVKPNNQARPYAASRNFSSMSMGSLSRPRTSSGINQGGPITSVTINKDLLTPLKIEIDPSIQTVRTQEKEQIKSLNNRFISFIEQVRSLEQQNQMLETKWKLLQGQTAADSTIEPMMKLYIANLQKQLQGISNEGSKLDAEQKAMHNMVDEYKTKYEQELNRRNDLENEFVVLKKDVDASYLSKVDLEEMMSALSDEVEFLKRLYNEELRELQESMKETSVVLQMDNSRDLAMDQIIDCIKAQYEEIAAQSRQEAESWYKNKFDQMTVTAEQHNRELRSTKAQVNELRRRIKMLQGEISTAKAQCTNLQQQIDGAEASGELAVKDGKARIRDLEVAQQEAKQTMTRQVRQYHDLMNVKMALDIEISTYSELLLGEEGRIGQDSVVSVRTVPTTSSAVVQVDSGSQRKLNAVVIKTVETQNRSYN